MVDRPIGLFDSGIGGLSVFMELQRQLPAENIIYFADTLHMPYGERSPQQLQEIVYAILRFLQEQDAKLVIMACNTSSALVLDAAQSVFPMPLIGMIKPIAANLASCQPASLGIMATAATTQSGAYVAELRQAGFTGELHCQACPELASLIEMCIDDERLDHLVQEYIEPLQAAGVEQVLLGCTHYPFASNAISAAFGSGVHLINPATAVVNTARQLLAAKKLLRAGGIGHSRAYVSGDLQSFKHRSSQLLGAPLVANRVKLTSDLANKYIVC